MCYVYIWFTLLLCTYAYPDPQLIAKIFQSVTDSLIKRGRCRHPESRSRHSDWEREISSFVWIHSPGKEERSLFASMEFVRIPNGTVGNASGYLHRSKFRDYIQGHDILLTKAATFAIAQELGSQ